MAKRLLFTPAILREIPCWVADGVALEEIAGRVGCTLNTLKAKCSRYKISLDQRKQQAWQKQFAAGTVKPRLSISSHCQARFDEHALPRGMTAEQLMVVCLEHIANDDLFTAVLDV